VCTGERKKTADEIKELMEKEAAEKAFLSQLYGGSATVLVLVLGFSMAQTKIMKDHAMLEKWAKSNGIYGVLPKTKDGKVDTDLALKLTGILVSIWPESQIDRDLADILTY
jgi:hypothetical protein